MAVSRPLVMGILNVTPDSFSDGGLYLDVGTAVARAEEMVLEGADVIDIGGESTRPGAAAVPLAEELRRTIPVIRRLAKAVRVPLAIDTSKADVAERAMDAGASIINDVTALRGDPRMAAVAA
ncbi:MAG: dihydropteroate synthase, partial [bacterium]